MITLACLALVLELTFGYPRRLVGAIGHPVIWIGRLIAVLDRRWNNLNWGFAPRRAAGMAALLLLLLVSGGLSFGLQYLLLGLPFGLIVLALLLNGALMMLQGDAHTLRRRA